MSLDESTIYDFPNTEAINEMGLIAVGGNLSEGTLLNAYKKGIFPWYNPGEIIQWYNPDPRFVLFPENVRISHSMRNIINRDIFRFTIDKSFSEVIHQCRIGKRKEQQGTWISDEIEHAYVNLHKKGFAHSAEAWENDKLVGGLYGVLLGKVFFGESMFTVRSNAGKFALIQFCKEIQQKGIKLIDCQVFTPHLESMGAEFISQKEFRKLLDQLI